jgi:hypothetical protein
LLEGYDYTFVSNNGNTGKAFLEVNNPGIINEIESWQPEAVLVYGWNYRSHLRTMRYFKGRSKVLFRGDSTLIGERKRNKKMVKEYSIKMGICSC